LASPRLPLQERRSKEGGPAVARLRSRLRSAGRDADSADDDGGVRNFGWAVTGLEAQYSQCGSLGRANVMRVSVARNLLLTFHWFVAEGFGPIGIYSAAYALWRPLDIKSPVRVALYSTFQRPACWTT
jgi:hypothetical protein